MPDLWPPMTAYNVIAQDRKFWIFNESHVIGLKNTQAVFWKTKDVHSIDYEILYNSCFLTL